MTDPQVYRLEIRWYFTGTLAEAQAEAARIAGLVDGSVTGIFDEDWLDRT